MRKMKHSGFPWIDDVPENWEVRKLKHYYKIQTGFTPDTKKQEFYDDECGYDWVNISDLQDGSTITESKKKISQLYIDKFKPEIIPQGSLLYSFKLSVGQTSYAGKPIYTNEAIASFLADENVDLHYLRYSSIFIIENAQTNIYNAKILNQDLINNAYVPFPPLPEQHRIASYLDTQCAHIDNIIEKTKASIEEYKKLKQAVITQAVTKGVRGDRPMKDSGIDYLASIPIEWDIISIGMAFDFIGGYAYKSERFCSETKNQVIRIGNVRNDMLILDSKSVFIDDEYATESIYCLILEDDILFSMTGTKGKKDYFYTVKVDLRDLNHKRLFLNQRVGCFRKKANVNMKYYCYLLKYERIKDYIFLFETGTANQGNLGIETIKRTKLYFPPLDEQHEIVAYLDKKCAEIDAVITKKQQFITEMENYKKSMIYEYVTGKKEVL